MLILMFLIVITISRNLNAFNINKRLATTQSYNDDNIEKVHSEQLLIQNLMKNYNKKLRPPETIQIKFAFNLNQIINLVEKEQIILLNAFIDHEWVDSRLKWSPEDYNNLTVVRISSDKLWTPDTFVYTTADHHGFLLPQNGAYFVVRHTGAIFWPNPMTQMRVKCRMGIVWFPFDEQLCELIFGSWSFTMNYLNYSLMIESPDLSNYTENNEWLLIAFKAFRAEIKYENWIEDDEFSEIRYKMILRRKPLFVITNCVLPAIMLTILTLTSFFIPFAQEMQIGISIMLAYSVFTLRLSDDVPAQSDSVPLVNIYFLLCMGFSLSAMVWFSIINKLREMKRVSKSCKKFALYYLSYIVSSKKTRNLLIKSYIKLSQDKNKNQSKSNHNVSNNTFNSYNSLNIQNSPIVTHNCRELGCKMAQSMPIKYDLHQQPPQLQLQQQQPFHYQQQPLLHYDKVWIPNNDSLNHNHNNIKLNQFPNIIANNHDLYDNIKVKKSKTIKEQRANSGCSTSPKLRKRSSKKSHKEITTSFNANASKKYNNMLNESIKSTLSATGTIISTTVIDDNESQSDNDKQIKRYLTRDELVTHIFDIINRMVFLLFLIFILQVNLITLIICPMFIQTPLVINDKIK